MNHDLHRAGSALIPPKPNIMNLDANMTFDFWNNRNFQALKID